MYKVVEIYSVQDLKAYYRKLFAKILHSSYNILYIGYEDDDILLPILSENSFNVVAVDRESRINKFYPNVQYVQVDFFNIKFSTSKNFDYIIFSFVLHENAQELHEKFISLAKKISNNIIIIEPLLRKDLDGIEFEKQMGLYFASKNQIKRYYDSVYWKKIVGFNKNRDMCIMLSRSRNFEKIQVRGKHRKLEISIQDIIVLILKK